MPSYEASVSQRLINSFRLGRIRANPNRASWAARDLFRSGTSVAKSAGSPCSCLIGQRSRQRSSVRGDGLRSHDCTVMIAFTDDAKAMLIPQLHCIAGIHTDDIALRYASSSEPTWMEWME